MITPDIIENKDFAKSIRGYSCVEVDEFLDEIIEELKSLLDENRQMKLELSTLRQAVDSYKTPSDSVVDTLESAKKLMKDISESAERRAEIIIKNAYLDAENIKKEAREAVKKWAQDTEGFRKGASAFIGDYKDALIAEKDAIDKKLDELSDMDKRLSEALYKMPENSLDEGFGEEFFSGLKKNVASDTETQEKTKPECYQSAEEILRDYSNTTPSKPAEVKLESSINYRMQDTLLWDGPDGQVRVVEKDDKSVEDLLKSQSLDIKIELPKEDKSVHGTSNNLSVDDLVEKKNRTIEKVYAPRETVALDSQQLRDMLDKNK